MDIGENLTKGKVYKKEEIERKYEELHAMQKEMNKYADLSDEEEEKEEE